MTINVNLQGVTPRQVAQHFHDSGVDQFTFLSMMMDASRLIWKRDIKGASCCNGEIMVNLGCFNEHVETAHPND